MSGCTIQKRESANYNGAYTGFLANTEDECLMQCIDKYPECVAVDFNLENHACSAHNRQSGIGRWQTNRCCNRYEIICDRT